MGLHPKARELIDLLVVPGVPQLHELPIEIARQAMASMAAMVPQGPTVARVEDRTVESTAGPVPVRIYWPSERGMRPAILMFHGGGWALGDLATQDVPSRAVANASQCVVVSVDYRLAPEHKFPAAAEDCYAVTCWVAEHAAELGVDATRLAVAGDSAGGNLAAAVALMARDRGGPTLALQWLIYPALDSTCDAPSQHENAEGLLLSRAAMQWFWGMYLSAEGDHHNPYACPPTSADLRGLPPALVQTAEFDPLRDEGERYAAQLRAAGVEVEHTRYDGMIHGFFAMLDRFDEATAAVEQGASALRRRFRLGD